MLESNKVYRNFNRKNRFLGIIDYKTLVILLGYMWIVWETSSKIFNNIIYSVYLLMFLTIPVIGLVYANRYEMEQKTRKGGASRESCPHPDERD